MQSQTGHAPALIGDSAVDAQGVKPLEQCEPLRKTGCRWRVQPLQLSRVCDTPKGQFQYERCEVGPEVKAKGSGGKPAQQDMRPVSAGAAK